VTVRNTTLLMVLGTAAASMALSGCCPKKVLWKDKPKPAEAPKVVEPEDLLPPKPMPDRSGLPKPGTAKTWAPPAVTSWKMPNGITVWHLKQSQAPLLSLTMMLPNGSAADPAKKEGTTALMVDMLDEGAGTLSSLQLGEAWQRLATDYGAGTAVDILYFSLDMLADKLEPSLALLSDVLRKPKFDKAEFERRKSQRVQSALAGEASPGMGRSNVLRRVLSGTGYAGASSNGNKATLARIRLNDVKKQFKALIQPEGAHIIAVGDVDKAALEAALTKTLGDWKGTPKPKLLPVATKPLEKGIHIVDYPGASQSAIAVARRAAPWATKDNFTKLMMNRVMGGMFTSRLNMNLREDKGYSYGAGSAFVRRKLAGVWLAYAGVKAETTALSLEEIRKEIEGMATGSKPITEQEFLMAMGGLLGSYPGKFETFSDVTNQIVPLAQHGLPLDWLKTWPDKVKAVTVAQAMEEAKGLMTKADGTAAATVWDAFVIVVAGPREKIEADLKKLGVPLIPYDAEGNRLKKWVPAKKADAKKGK